MIHCFKYLNTFSHIKDQDKLGWLIQILLTQIRHGLSKFGYLGHIYNYQEILEKRISSYVL